MFRITMDCDVLLKFPLIRVIFGSNVILVHRIKSVPPIRVHRSPPRNMLKKTSFLDCPSLRYVSSMSYRRLDKHCSQFVSGSNPNKHPVCTSGLLIRTFDPNFTPIGFSVKKQHQLLCRKL